MQILVVMHHNNSPPGICGQTILERAGFYDSYLPTENYASSAPHELSDLPDTLKATTVCWCSAGRWIPGTRRTTRISPRPWP